MSVDEHTKKVLIGCMAVLCVLLWVCFPISSYKPTPPVEPPKPVPTPMPIITPSPEIKEPVTQEPEEPYRFRVEPSPVKVVESDEWLSLSSHIWRGVKVYMGSGPQKRYICEIIDFDEDHRQTLPDGSIDEFRGLKVRYPNGNEEWKDRVAWIMNDYLFVKASDPALQ